MTKAWNLMTLRELTTQFDYGLSCGLSADPRGVPVLRMGNLKGGRVSFDDLKYVPADVVRAQDLLEPGDILLNRTNSAALVGKVGLFSSTDRITYASYLFRLRSEPSLAWPEWLAQVLGSPQYQERLRELATPGVSQVNLNREVVRDLDMPVPPLPEQRKIAAILTSVDEAIEGTQAVIEQLGVVKKAMMAELLTRGIPGRHTRFKMTDIGEVPESWDVVPLEELSSLITKGESPKWQGFEYQKSGALFVTSENVRDALIDTSSPKYIPFEFSEKLKRCKLETGDLLVNIVGASIGRAAVWDGRYSHANVNQAVAVVRIVQSRLLSSMALQVVYSDAGQKYLGLTLVDNARPNVSLGSLRNFPMPVPSMDEQEAICRVAASLDDRLRVETGLLHGLQETKAALMSVLLTGEVRVQPDEDAA